MIELAFEGKRFWDLRRWKLAADYMNDKPIQAWSVLAEEGSADAYYQLLTIYTQEFVTRDYLWPISESELAKNPNLVQNPGWK